MRLEDLLEVLFRGGVRGSIRRWLNKDVRKGIGCYNMAIKDKSQNFKRILEEVTEKYGSIDEIKQYVVNWVEKNYNTIPKEYRSVADQILKGEIKDVIEAVKLILLTFYRGDVYVAVGGYGGVLVPYRITEGGFKEL